MSCVVASLSNLHSQLAVVQGLVRYRAQQIGQRITPIGQRCAPLSYGVVVSQKYDPNRHLGQKVVRDHRDKKRWAIDQIEWLIYKVSGPIHCTGMLLTSKTGRSSGRPRRCEALQSKATTCTTAQTLESSFRVLH